jgi:hypothetical protein
MAGVVHCLDYGVAVVDAGESVCEFVHHPVVVLIGFCAYFCQAARSFLTNRWDDRKSTPFLMLSAIASRAHEAAGFGLAQVSTLSAPSRGTPSAARGPRQPGMLKYVRLTIIPAR